VEDVKNSEQSRMDSSLYADALHLHNPQEAVHKGRPQRRGFGQMRKPADRGLKDLVEVRMVVLFLLFQHALQTLLMGDSY